MAVKKQIMILVYDSLGGYITTWSTAVFSNFTKELNGGLGECILTLPYAFDYTGPDLVEGNNVEIRVADFDTNKVNVAPGDAARVIYQGYISMIEPLLDGSKENITVHLLGHYTKLSIDILKDTSGKKTTLFSDTTSGLSTSGGSAADIGKIMRAVIDKYRSETTNPMISYLYTDIPDTGTNALATFRQLTYRETMDKLRSFAPAGVYWYIDENNNVKFKPQPTTPTHKFYFGKHLTYVKVERSLEKTRNVLFLWNGETGSPIYNQYTDTASITRYGRRAAVVKDVSIGDSTTADAYGAKFLAENKNPIIKLSCTILDNNGSDLDADGVPLKGYDIESIQPGDTCSFYGFNLGYSDVFQDNMLITKVTYSLGKVDIEVEITKTGFLDAQQDNTKKINEIAATAGPVPATYT